MKPIPSYTDFFRPEPLVEAGTIRRRSYLEASPFPHLVLDDFFPLAMVEELARAFERVDPEGWIQRDGSQSLKRGCPDETAMDPVIRSFLHHLSSGPFLRFLEALTGIDGLIGDPHFQGAGLHEIDRGGFLKIHADFNVHKTLRLDRRLNLLLYLNEDWREEYGGHLELWDQDMKACERSILPIFNRCVIFSTTDTSFHGHPAPLACPPDRSRRSIALYYYTNGRPAEEVSAPHSTLYRRRPGEAETGALLTHYLRTLVQLITPPILLKAGRAVTRPLTRAPRRRG